MGKLEKFLDNTLLVLCLVFLGVILYSVTLGDINDLLLIDDVIVSVYDYFSNI